MEDILASIRRIISDEQGSADDAEIGEEVSSPLQTVLEITERHVSPPLSSEASGRESGMNGGGFMQREPLHDDRSAAMSMNGYGLERQAFSPDVTSKPVAASVQAAALPCEKHPDKSLMSRVTAAAVSDAFGRLGAAREARQQQTVEDLMKEMLRPMLKTWLDDNLPVIVERLVQAEIERVTRS